MTTKYHINPASGGPNICTAQTPEGCKYAEPDSPPPPHYASKDEARAAYDASNKDKTVAAGVSKKGAKADMATNGANDTASKDEAAVAKSWQGDDGLRDPDPERGQRMREKYPHMHNRFVPRPEDSEVVRAPHRDTDPSGGYMGGDKFVGGKREESQQEIGSSYISQADAAKAVREDLKKAINAGELPSDLAYSVRQDTGSFVTSLSIVVGKKDGRKMVPLPKNLLYREPDQERLDHLLHSGAPAKDYVDENRSMNGSHWGNGRVKTDEAGQLEEYLEALGNQWAYTESNSMTDYFRSSNSANVHWSYS